MNILHQPQNAHGKSEGLHGYVHSSKAILLKHNLDLVRNKLLWSAKQKRSQIGKSVKLCEVPSSHDCEKDLERLQFVEPQQALAMQKYPA